MRKYLTTGKDGGISEYTVIWSKTTFYVISVNMEDKGRRLSIPFDELHYPQLFDKKSIEEQIVLYITKAFPESEDHAIVIYSTDDYEKKIFDIVVWNRLDFD